MYVEAFQIWRRERDIIEEEMKRLIAMWRSGAAEGRQIRRIQFEILVQRRETAARNLLRSDRAARPAR